MQNKIPGDIIKVTYKAKIETAEEGSQPSLTYKWLSDNEVEWVINNPLNNTLYTLIFRNYYTFGSAFTEVYLRNGATKVWESPEQNTDETNPYRIGFVQTPFVIFPAFVFKVPPKSKLSVPEYGFSKEYPPENYYLVPVTPVEPATYIISYDPMLPVIYSLQAQEPVLSMPSPYVLRALVFTTPTNVSPFFLRYMIRYNIILKLIMPFTV